MNKREFGGGQKEPTIISTLINPLPLKFINLAVDLQTELLVVTRRVRGRRVLQRVLLGALRGVQGVGELPAGDADGFARL